MALGETANLAINLQLKGNAAAGIAGVNRQLAGLHTTVGKVSTGWYTLGSGIGLAIKRGAIIGVAALTGLVGLVARSVKEGQDAQNVQLKYAQAIARSGKITAEYTRLLNEQQAAILELAGVDDERVKSIQTQLIQYGLAGEAVQKLTLASFEAAKATGRDVSAVALAVGKSALGTATALQRIGIFVDKAKYKLDPYGETLRALSRYTGTLAATSGTLDVRMGVLREKMANVREELGIKLLPVITRIVDVVGSRLVPAFAKFVDRILPDIQRGLNEFALMLEGGGASKAIDAIGTSLAALVDVMKLVAAPARAIVNAFMGLPKEVQAILIGGFAINKLSGGLIAKGIGTIVIDQFAARGASPANPVFVADTTLAGGGAAGRLGGIISTAVAFLPAAIAGAIAAGLFTQVLIPQAQALTEQAKQLPKKTADFVKTATTAELQAALRGAREQGANPIFGLGQFLPFGVGELAGIPQAMQAIQETERELIAELTARAHGEDQRQTKAEQTSRRQYDAAITQHAASERMDAAAATFEDASSALIHSNLFRKAQDVREVLGVKTSGEALRAMLKGGGEAGYGEFVTGQAISLALINALRIQGNDPADLHSAAYNLKDLRRLQAKFVAQGDVAMARKIGADIASLEAEMRRVREATNRTTAAVKDITFPTVITVIATRTGEDRGTVIPAQTKPKGAAASSLTADRHKGFGVSGMVHSATRMLVGEAGSEYVAVLRNPRAALLPQSQPATLNINVRTAISARQNDRGTAVQRRWGPTPTMAHAR